MIKRFFSNKINFTRIRESIYYSKIKNNCNLFDIKYGNIKKCKICDRLIFDCDLCKNFNQIYFLKKFN